MLRVCYVYRYRKVLCVTHELSTADVGLPYLSHVFRPAPVLTVFGRSARLEPAIKVEEALWYCWKDAIQLKNTGQ